MISNRPPPSLIFCEIACSSRMHLLIWSQNQKMQIQSMHSKNLSTYHARSRGFGSLQSSIESSKLPILEMADRNVVWTKKLKLLQPRIHAHSLTIYHDASFVDAPVRCWQSQKTSNQITALWSCGLCVWKKSRIELTVSAKVAFQEWLTNQFAIPTSSRVAASCRKILT